MSDIFHRVRRCVCEALSVDEHEVEPETKLTADLGAESIDLLDLVFRVEKEFGLKSMRRDEFFPAHILDNPQYVDGDRLTPDGMAELKKALPFVDFGNFEQKPVITDFPAVLSVADICRHVERELTSQQA